MRKNGFLGLLVILLVFNLIGCGNDSDENKEFTVTFNLDGGNINGNTESIIIKLKSGEMISDLPEPSKVENNHFGGWFTEKNGLGNEFKSTTKVNADITIYAKWIKYTVPPNLWGKWELFTQEGTWFYRCTFNNNTYSYEWGDYFEDLKESEEYGYGYNIEHSYTADVLSFINKNNDNENTKNEFIIGYELNSKIISNINLEEGHWGSVGNDLISSFFINASNNKLVINNNNNIFIKQ